MRAGVLQSLVVFLVLIVCATAATAEDQIVHDAEYYVLEAQNGQRWSAEDGKLDERLAALREKYGRPPNIVHVMCCLLYTSDAADDSALV